MEHPLADEDMTMLVLRALARTYTDETRCAHTGHYRASSPSPEHRAHTLRTMLREALRAMCMSSRVCALWKKASTVAIDALLELVKAQFQHVQMAVLGFLESEPALYEGASLAPGVPREEAIRIFTNLRTGEQSALEPLYTCFEVPVSPRRRSGGPMPLGNVRNPIAPYRETFMEWSPAHLVRQARTAGHWLRTWTAELAWVDPPTHNGEALWLAMQRGCAVCGAQCALQGHRVDLANAEHHNTKEHDVIMAMSDRAPVQGRSPWVGLNAYVVIPWDLPNVHTRLVGGVPHDPVTRLATRILPYTHRAHMVTLTFRYERAHFAAGTESSDAYRYYNCYFTVPPGVDEGQYGQTVDEIMLANVLQSLETTPHPNDSQWSHKGFIKGLFAKRRAAIHDSGLCDYMIGKGLPVEVINGVSHAKEFKATLPLFPMCGHPKAHCWCSVLDLSEAQFRHLAWTVGVVAQPSAAQQDPKQVERWRKQTLRHAIGFLSDRLPQFDHSAFFRASAFGANGASLYNRLVDMPLQNLTDPYTSRILNPIEFVYEAYAPAERAVSTNQLLLETWPDFEDLLEGTVPNCTRILNRQVRIDATYEEMLKHFVRLDSVLGPAWRKVRADEASVFTGGEAEWLRRMLLKLALRHLARSPDLAPAPLLLRHSRILPGAPRHPDVWLRWFLRALSSPQRRRASFDEAEADGRDWVYQTEVELCNTFVIDANRQHVTDRIDRDNIGVHVTFYVLTSKPDTNSPMHMRAVFAIHMSTLQEIVVGVDYTDAELDESLWDASDMAGTSVAMSTDGESKALAEWHRDARGACERLTRHVHRYTTLGLDLLRRFLDAECIAAAPGVRVDGWKSLRSHCDTGEWFASYRIDAFCQKRGFATCMCSAGCDAVCGKHDI